MRGTLLSIALVAFSALTLIDYSAAADPECLYRKERNLPMHWANPTDCGRYYRCTNRNVMREVLCTGDKEYNPKTGKCAIAGKGYCKLTYAAPLNGETNACAHEMDGAYIPESGKCRDFYICWNKLSYPQECGEGSFFNSTSATCEPDEEDKCWQNVCLEQADGTTRADNESCTSFYICHNEEATLQKCSSGSYFNVHDGNCQPDEEDKCWQNVCLEQADGTTRADNESCTSFYICHNEEATLQKCSYGSYFNAHDGNCQPDENNNNCWQNFCLEAFDGELIKNPDNCHGYYACNNKTATPKECAEGSYFNWNLKVCEVGECPSDETTKPTEDCTQATAPVPCESCTCPGGYKEGEMLPYPDNCMYYYICTGGKLVQKSCHAGNYFERNVGICTPDTKGECPQCKQSLRRARRTAEETQIDTQSVAQPSCLNRFFEGEIIPHDQCNKYQVCSEGQLRVYDCETGNYFNKESKACVADVENTCSSQSNSIERVFTCKGRYFEGQIMPHQDCNKYLICSKGQLLTQDCRVGTYFNQNLEACIDDEHNVCQVKSVSIYQANEKDDVDDHLKNCTCPGGYTPGTLLKHPSECNKYYICQNGQLVLRDCGKGNMFDDSLRVCMPDVDNKCKPSSDSDCDTDTSICSGQKNGKLLPNKNKCNSFYQCLNGEAQANTCEADEWFNPDKESCEVDLNAVCINPCLATRGIQFLPHPDCRKYFLCNNGEVHVRDCLGTDAFDRKLRICSPDASCDSNLCHNKPDGTTLQYDEDKNKFYVCLSGVAVLNNCPENSTFDLSVGVCLPRPSTNCNQDLCETERNLGAFPTLDESDNAFCVCRDGEAFEMQCATDYIFEPHLGICLSNAPCDPEICLDEPEYTVSMNRNDTHSFCLCVSEVPVIVECPKNGTFNEIVMKCQPEATQDPNCNPTYCLTKPDYTTGPALNTNNGFCVCVEGGSKYYPCLDDSIYSIGKGICIPESPEYSCNVTKCADGGTTLFPTYNDDYAFCYCEDSTHVVVRNCPSGYKFNPTQLVCMPEFCDSRQCLNPHNQNIPFAAIDYPYGFCMCNGTTANLYECPEDSMFDPQKLVCTHKVNLECDVSLCRVQGKPYPYDTPAINDPYSFCYCRDKDTVELFHCPVGTIYDIQFSACMKEEAPTPPTDCEDHCTCPGGYPAGSILPHPQNCNQYYICSKGVLKLSNCAAGNFFSASQSVCLKDEDGKCTELASAPTTCVGAYRENEVISNPSNRRTFFRCLNARLHLESCDAGHYFNSQRGVCVAEPLSNWNYKPRSALSSDSDNDELFAANDTDDSVVNAEDISCQNNTKRSVPSNCSQYEVCLNDQWRRRSCTHQRYYNPEEQKCLEPRDDMVCGYAKVSDLPACTSDIEQQTLPHKNITRCGQYFRCVHGKWRLKYCRKSEYYSRRLGTCMQTSLKNICEARNASEGVAQSADASDCRHTEVRAAVENCGKYLMCLDGEWWYHYCPLGMFFNRTLNYCMPNDEGQCALVVPSKNSGLSVESCSREGEKREVPFNCTAFEMCENGTWHRRSCEKNFMHDPFMEECVTSDDGHCASNGLRRACRNGEIRSWTTKENCSQFLYCEANNWLTGACLNAHTFSENIKACVPHDRKDRCKPVWVASGGEAALLPKADNDCLCIGQTDGRFVSHPNDCTRYYVCLIGRALNELQCPMGSFFDAKLGYCRANDGSCIQPLLKDLCRNASNDALVPNPFDCRAYYNCSISNVSSQVAFCMDGQYFDSESRICLLDDGHCGLQRPQAKCGNQFEEGRRLPHELYCNVFYACVNELAVPFECPIGYLFNPVLERCLEDVEAQCLNGEWLDSRNETMLLSCGNLADGTLLPNRTDCRRYFNCSMGYAEPKRCAEGSYFDLEKLLCSPDDGSVCPSSDDEFKNNSLALDPLACEGKHGGLFPDPTNCNEFYVCINGKMKHEFCYTNHFFNTTANQCQPYERLKNENRKDNENENENITAFEEGVEEIIANSIQSSLIDPAIMANETPTMNITLPSEQCTDRPTNFSDLCIAAHIPEGGSIALQGDCRRYISCQDNVPNAQRCRNGESYDSLIGFCRQNDGTCLLENGQRVGECNGRHGQLTRDADNCRGYFVCINGQKIPRECEENEYFDKMLNSCRHDTRMQCSSSPKKATDEQKSDVSCNGLSEANLYPYVHDHCRSYFQCVNGTPKIHECVDGLYFDATTNRCVKDIHECVMPSTTTAMTMATTTTTTSKTTNTPSNLLRAPDESSDEKPKHRCEAAVIGKPYANIDDRCRSYYICKSTESIVYIPCPKGTLYSTEKRACASANNVVCGI